MSGLLYRAPRGISPVRFGADEVGLELGNHREHVEQQPAHRIGRVVHRPTEAEPDPSSREIVGDRPGVRQRPGQPVEFGDDQGVALPAGGQCFPQTWSVVVAAGQRNEHHR
jgi:hypothetical protein